MPIKYITHTWDGGNSVFKESVAGNDAYIQLGIDTHGTDLKMFGVTTASFFLWDESADALELHGDCRIDLSSCTTKAANTDGGVLKAGTSGSPVTEDTADMKFISLYFDNGAVSGDNRGIYNKLSLTGAGGGGESFRTYTDVVDVAGGTAHGAHISLGFGTSGSLTGQGMAARCTLHLPTTALPSSNVTYSAIQAEIFSDGANSDPSGNKLSALRILNDGNAGGKADVDDDCALMELSGWTSATGNMYYSNTLRIRIDTTSKYLIMSTTEDELALTADGRINLSACTTKAANTDGGIIKAGTSGARVTEDTANMKFISLYLDNGATSGDNRGIYNRLYLTGAGGGGESLRTYTDVEDVAGTTAHGAHISLGFGTSGSLTGQGIAARCTLHMPATALPASNVTYSAIQAEIWSDGANSDPSGNKLSAIRILNDGNASGKADVDDDCAMIELMGWTSATGNMYYGNTLRMRIDTTDKYLVMSTTENCLTMTTAATTQLSLANTVSGTGASKTAEIAVTSTKTHTSDYEYALFCSITRSGAGAAGGQSTVIGADIYPSMTTASYLRCFEGYIGTIANKTVDGAIGFALYMEDVGTACGYATCAMLHRVVTNKATQDSFINFRNHGATPANSLFEITGGAISDYLFDVFSLTAPFAAGGSGDITFADAWIKIPIKVAGVTYNLVASVTPS